MSHFAALVITNEPTEDAIAKALARYHEFECTGRDDEYVQDIDITAEARLKFLEQKTHLYIDGEGNPHDPDQDQFYRDPTTEEAVTLGRMPGSFGCGNGMMWISRDWGDGLGYRPKIHFLPEGWTEGDVPAEEQTTFLEWVTDYYGKEQVRLSEEAVSNGIYRLYLGATTDGERAAALNEMLRKYPLALTEEHKFGYVLTDRNDNVLRIIRRTNPAAKYDWYATGGRWSNFFLLKPGRVGISFAQEQATRRLLIGAEVRAAMGAPTREPDEQDRRDLALLDYAPPERADIAFKGDIDVEGMRAEAATKGARYYDGYHAIISRYEPIVPFKTICLKHGVDLDREREAVDGVKINAARDEYHEQPAVKALWDSRDYLFLDEETEELLRGPRDVYIERQRQEALLLFAVVKDGVWYQRGEMGWFGSASDEISNEEWLTHYNMLIEDVPDDAVLAVVDMHI